MGLSLPRLARRSASCRTRGRTALRCGGLLLLGLLTGCQSTARGRNPDAVGAYYAYEFTDARDAVRHSALAPAHRETILDNLRLGLSALADGAPGEAEDALLRAYDLLSTAGLNADRTTEAEIFNENVRIWKGEPFEQALAYTAVASFYASRGDWENARAAASNSLFRLTDFGKDQNARTLAEHATRDEDYLETGYTAVDTNFALGAIMQGLGRDLSGAGHADASYAIAREINPALGPLLDTLAGRDFDTLLIVDYGKGPIKESWGRDRALVRFAVIDQVSGPIEVSVEDVQTVRFDPVCNVNEMAADHRWNNLEDVRRAKSFLGDALLIGGAVVIEGGNNHKDRDALIGAGMILAGLIAKSNAEADTRHLEMLPQLVYLVPLKLEIARTLSVRVGSHPPLRLPGVEPGSLRKPRTLYLRLHGRDSMPPPWLNASATVYGNAHTGVRPGDYPWILGGHDVSMPSRATLDAYHASGYLKDWTVSDLRALYDAEDITIGSTSRHILEGGDGLFAPDPDTLGARRLFGQRHPAWTPRSDRARNAARTIRVQRAPDRSPTEPTP